MYNRVFDIENRLDEGMFLFGARQVGKSTLLKERFPQAIYIDLLDSGLRKRFRQNPSLFKEMLIKYPAETLVIVDEIQKVPELLDEVHSLMVSPGLFFILSGSSARKIRQSGVNQLGGRAIPETLFPLVSAEIPDYELDKAVQNGLIPRHYVVKDAKNRLKAYIELYLKEEIVEEAAVRNVDNFERFMEIAAISDGEIINYENIAADCGISANTVKSYFRILYDSLIGYEIPAYRKVVKRKLTQAPKFYYFDVGVANYLMRRYRLQPGTPEYGHAFEHLVMQEIIAYLGYKGEQDLLSYWHAYTGEEVDAVIGDAQTAIEIKSTEQVQRKHLTGLKNFHEEHPEAKLILVSRDKITRRHENVDLYYVTDFFKAMWREEIEFH